MNGDQLPIDFARAARDDGIKRAAEHAGAEWMRRAIDDFARFLRERGEATLEQWRFDWLARGNEGPPSHKAYGAVASAAARSGKAVNTKRYVQAVSKKTHAHPVPIWRAP
jgi:phosphohistidine phosphatase SixA